MAEPKPHATREEVEHALTSLTKPQRLRLKKFADYRVRGLGRAAKGNGEDLLQEAIKATLIGTEAGKAGRRWSKEVDIVKHLIEAMRSIASHWREAASVEEIRESELATVDDEGESHSPFEKLVDPAPDALRAAQAKQEVYRILGLFKDDDNAILVLEGWYREGWKREDFINLGMSPSDYDAAVKRILYRVSHER